MIYFLIPIFNEADNITNLAKELSDYRNNDECFFVFCDDGSTDKSSALITELFEKSILLGDGKNHGPGFAFNLGFEWILTHSKNPTDIIVTIEADCTSDLTALAEMLQKNQEGFALVLASVYAKGGDFKQLNPLRRFLSFSLNLLVRQILKTKISTWSSFYRVYSVELIRSIKKNFDTIIAEDGFTCKVEILLKAVKCNARIIEVPITIDASKRIGKSKMKILKTSIQYFFFLSKYLFSKPTSKTRLS